MKPLGCMQGFNWYRARLRQDRDGDIAEEFLEESRNARGKVQRDEALHLPALQVHQCFYLHSLGFTKVQTYAAS